MRITNNMLVDNMLYNLNENLNRFEEINTQVTTGKKFQVPSDDPIGVSKSLKFHTDLAKVDQYKRNAEDAYYWMKETETALMEIGEILHRAKDLAIDAANGTKADEDLLKIKEEIDQLKEHLIEFGNTTFAGRSVFTGYKTNTKLLDENGNYMLSDGKKHGEIKDGDAVVLKKDEVFEYNVGVSERIKVNTVGIKVFGVVKKDGEDGGFGETSVNGYVYDKDKGKFKLVKVEDENEKIKKTSKSYLIQVFDDFSTALESGKNEDIQSAIENTKACMEQVLSVRAEIGAKTNRLKLTKDKLESQYLSTKELLSKNEDVDMAEAYTELKMAENVYRSSLAAGARIIQPSLVDFLR